MIYAYTRVSTQGQVCLRQEDAINEYCGEHGIVIDEWFSDKISGKTFMRENYLLLKERLEKGDTLVIKEIDRLSRDYDGIKEEWRWFMDHDINVVVVDMPMLTTGLGAKKGSLDGKFVANIVFELLCYLAEKERQKISERTKEGLESARARGVRLGRPSEHDHDADLRLVEDSIRSGEKWSDFLARTGMSQNRYYALRNEAKERAQGVLGTIDRVKNTKEEIVRLYGEGVRPSEISTKLGVSRGNVYAILADSGIERKRVGYKLNERDRQIIEMHRKGINAVQISKVVGLEPGTVRNIIKMHSDKY